MTQQQYEAEVNKLRLKAKQNPEQTTKIADQVINLMTKRLLSIPQEAK